MFCFFFGEEMKFFKKVYFQRQRERKRENAKQALCYQRRTQHRALSQELWDHDLSWTLNNWATQALKYIYIYIFFFTFLLSLWSTCFLQLANFFLMTKILIVIVKSLRSSEKYEEQMILTLPLGKF